MLIQILDIIGMIGGLTGAILIGQLNRNGFLAFIIGSSAHGTMGYIQGNYGLTFLCLSFILIDIYYYIKWRK